MILNNFVTNGEMFCFINHFMWHLFQHLLEERSLIVILPGLFNQVGYMSFWMMMISTAHRESNISKKNQIQIFSRKYLELPFYTSVFVHMKVMVNILLKMLSILLPKAASTYLDQHHNVERKDPLKHVERWWWKL